MGANEEVKRLDQPKHLCFFGYVLLIIVVVVVVVVDCCYWLLISFDVFSYGSTFFGVFKSFKNCFMW